MLNCMSFRRLIVMAGIAEVMRQMMMQLQLRQIPTQEADFFSRHPEFKSFSNARTKSHGEQDTLTMRYSLHCKDRGAKLCHSLDHTALAIPGAKDRARATMPVTATAASRLSLFRPSLCSDML